MTWHLGLTRESIGKIPKGVSVAFRRNSEHQLACGITWWVVHKGNVAHIAESYGGVNCSRIFGATKRGGEYVAGAGPKTTAKLESLLVNLAKPYATNQVHSEGKNRSKTLPV